MDANTKLGPNATGDPWQSTIDQPMQYPEEFQGVVQERVAPVTLQDLRAFLATAERAVDLATAADWGSLEVHARAVLDSAHRAVGMRQLLDELGQKTLDARQQLLAQFGIDALAESLASAQTNIYSLTNKKNGALAEYRATQAEMESVKNDVLLSGQIDGKNAEVRNAQIAAALAGNPITQQVEKLRGQLDSLDAELDLWRMRYTTAKGRLAAATAGIGLLAG